MQFEIIFSCAICLVILLLTSCIRRLIYESKWGFQWWVDVGRVRWSYDQALLCRPILVFTDSFLRIDFNSHELSVLAAGVNHNQYLTVWPLCTTREKLLCRRQQEKLKLWLMCVYQTVAALEERAPNQWRHNNRSVFEAFALKTANELRSSLHAHV